jgi:hypothetical protein
MNEKSLDSHNAWHYVSVYSNARIWKCSSNRTILLLKNCVYVLRRVGKIADCESSGLYQCCWIKLLKQLNSYWKTRSSSIQTMHVCLEQESQIMQRRTALLFLKHMCAYREYITKRVHWNYYHLQRINYNGNKNTRRHSLL